MTGTQAHGILQQKGVTHLHHANSVSTSCSFLSLGGLASRGAVAAAGLPQTPQYSDASDQAFGIWNDVFTDGVDVHARGRRRNLYGPVLFTVPVGLLLQLPPQTDVMIMRKNPVHWIVGEPDSDRYFLTPADLSTGYNFGDFGQHVVFRTPSGVVPFAYNPVHVVLDAPNYQFTATQTMVYVAGAAKLQAAAQARGLQVAVAPRACSPACACAAGYTAAIAGAVF